MYLLVRGIGGSRVQRASAQWLASGVPCSCSFACFLSSVYSSCSSCFLSYSDLPFSPLSSFLLRRVLRHVLRPSCKARQSTLDLEEANRVPKLLLQFNEIIRTTRSTASCCLFPSCGWRLAVESAPFRVTWPLKHRREEFYVRPGARALRCLRQARARASSFWECVIGTRTCLFRCFWLLHDALGAFEA